MSAQAISLLALAVDAGGVITANRFVTPAGIQAVDGSNTLGVARMSAAAADKLTVDALGTAVVEAGAAVAKGASLKSNSQGQAITWASAGAKVAIALEAASAAGQLIEVLLIPNLA